MEKNFKSSFSYDRKPKKVRSELLRSFQSIYYISRILSINSYRNNNGNFENLKWSNKFYGGVLIFFVVFVSVFSMVVRILYSYGTMALTTIVLDFLTLFCQVILVLISVWFAIGKHGNLMRAFFEKTEKIDEALIALPKNYESVRIRLWAKCVFVTIVVVTFGIAETFLCLELDFWYLSVLSSSSFKYLLLYYNFVVFLQIDAVVDIVKTRFKLVNYILRSIENAEVNVSTIEVVKKKIVGIPDLHVIFETHSLLCDLVDVINEVHGFQILFMICSNIVTILFLLNWGIIFALLRMLKDNDDVGLDDGLNYKYAIIGIQGMLCFAFVIMSILLAAHCSSTVNEADETKSIAQKLLLQESTSITETRRYGQMYEEELVLFINTSASPIFSAGGFFTVDYTLLLAIMGAVTSYFIVLLQFANVEGKKIV